MKATYLSLLLLFGRKNCIDRGVNCPFILFWGVFSSAGEHYKVGYSLNTFAARIHLADVLIIPETLSTVSPST